MDRFGNHAASCATGRHRIRRRNYLKDIISELLHDANIKCWPRKEELELELENGIGIADLLIINCIRISN